MCSRASIAKLGVALPISCICFRNVFALVVSDLREQSFPCVLSFFVMACACLLRVVSRSCLPCAHRSHHILLRCLKCNDRLILQCRTCSGRRVKHCRCRRQATVNVKKMVLLTMCHFLCFSCRAKQFTECKLSIRHDSFWKCRVGETSHPGPGGSRASMW